MKPRRIGVIARDSLSESYAKNMVEYLVATRGVAREDAITFVDNQIRSRVKVPKVRVVETERPGVLKTKVYPMSHFLRVVHDKVLTPSGSVYVAAYKKRSIVAILIEEFMKDRGAVKKKMFAAYAALQNSAGDIFQALQNSIKVTLNSLPGGYGFSSSIFYDKGSYNAITSSGRILISTSFTATEHILGANIPIFDEEEAVNLLITIKHKGPSGSVIRNIMERHGLRWVSRDEVIDYLNASLKRYSFTGDLRANINFTNILNSMSNERIQFIWYYSNLQHICFDNGDTFHTQIKQAFNVEFINTDSIVFNKDEFLGLDQDIMAIATTVLAKEIGGMDVYDISKNEVIAKRLIVVYKNINNFLQNFSDIFNLFLLHDIVAQKVLSRSSMQRDCVVISDTDSVIYTVLKWATWYTKQDGCVNMDSYNIAALATYWLTKANADEMAKFAISSGATNDDIGLIQMKSEFTYAALMLFDIKKVYAALSAAQEGIVFPELKPDIKGASIRGHGASPKAKKFTMGVLVEDVLKPVIEGNISAISLIDKVVAFENHVRKDLSEGGLDFLPMVSVRTAEMYKNSKQSTFFNAMAWNDIFSEKYDKINPPNKLPMVKIIPPTDQYFDWLKKKDKRIHDKFKKFLELHKKCPSAFFVEPMCKRIPEELMPLIDIKAIIYFNANPVYLTLASLNINIGHSKKHLLLSDIYG